VGAKTGILAYASGSVVDVLRSRPIEAGREEAESVLRRLHPAWPVSAEAVSPLVGNLSGRWSWARRRCGHCSGSSWKGARIRRMWMRPGFRLTDSA
jgi:hypothetical protein